MANYASGPSVQLRRLGIELRTLRESAQLSRQEVTNRTGINDVTLYRIEHGKTRPQQRTLRTLLDLFDADNRQRERLNELASNTRFPGWIRPYRSFLGETVITYLSFESEASSAHSYETTFVPGLLQTEEYARSLFKASLPLAGDENVETRVRARLDRQVVLTERVPALRMWAIVDEAALRRRIGSTETMSAQLQHLLSATERATVTVQVIPFDIGAYPGLSAPFVHLQFDGDADADIVCSDTMATVAYFDSPTEIRQYAQLFDHLRAVALSPEETRRFIAAILAEER